MRRPGLNVPVAESFSYNEGTAFGWLRWITFHLRQQRDGACALAANSRVVPLPSLSGVKRSGPTGMLLFVHSLKGNMKGWAFCPRTFSQQGAFCTWSVVTQENLLRY